MNENEKTADMVNTTDCLEAVSSFKAMKNFLFVVVLICLLLTQGIFWLERMGLVDKADCAEVFGSQVCGTQDVQEETPAVVEPEISEEISQRDIAIEALNAERGEQAAGEEESPGEVSRAGVEKEAVEKSRIPRPKCLHVYCVLRLCNFVLIIAAVLYCFCLLVSIKISLAGRLGGIAHISRAFFHSLFALVLLLPWQVFFPYVLHGVVYTPKELLCAEPLVVQSVVISEVFCYLRFTGLWIIVLVMFFCAQLRGRRWSRATLRRLGILQ